MRALVGITVVMAATPVLAQEQAPGPIVHPLYAEMPGSTRNGEVKRTFSEAVARYRLGPVEGMDIAPPPAPRAPERLKTIAIASEKRKFDEAEKELEPAVAEVMSNGGDGMSPGTLSELFLFQGITAQKAGWNDLEAPVTEIAPASA